ncbi:MAG TPA: hypothetical protein VN667_05890 [Burkholderiales bacterium]|nr:hypothetical protein [Burkholderiales bacterium]
MIEPHPLEQAIAKVGLVRLANEVGKTHQALRKWQRAGRMPRTEWTGETDYAKRIERLCDGTPSAEQLLKPWPKWPADVAPEAQPDSPAALVDPTHATASRGCDKPRAQAEVKPRQMPLNFNERRGRRGGE